MIIICRMRRALDLTYFMRRGYLVVASIQIKAESSWPTLFVEALLNCALVTTRVLQHLLNIYYPVFQAYTDAT